MSLIALDRILRRQRHQIAILAAAAALSGAVVVAHGGMGADHMGDHAAMCVAVLEVAAIAVAVVALARASIPSAPIFWSSPVSHRVALVFPGAPQPRARAGPPFLQVFRL